jgi:2-keto-4-pentenoate hydratase/2-oxohepta-3-ene-1,7-dioic acid hydratase in catechol pathway
VKLCMFSPKGAGLERGWPGRIEGDRVVQLAAQTLQAFFAGGGGAREHAEYPLAEVDLRAPVLYPPSVRLFHSHDFSFGNSAAIYGPETEIPFPQGTRRLDFGLGVAAVVGADGVIGGWTLASPWHAPDLPGEKQRDFAIALGPLVQTEPGDWAVHASLNGEPWRTANVEQSWHDVTARAAQNTRLRPGDLLIADLGPAGASIERGDTVELEADGIGRLRNRVGA